MKKAKRLLILLLMVAMFVAGAAVSDALNLNLICKEEIDVTTEEFREKLVEVSELAALNYEYDGNFEYDGGALKLMDKDIPFTDKSMTVHYEGVIKIGADMSKADVRMNAAGSKMTITVPHCKILSHEIDENSYEIVDKDNGLFNRVKIEDDVEFRMQQKEKVEKELKGAAVFEEADKNLAKQLIAFFGFGYPDVKVQVVYE